MAADRNSIKQELLKIWPHGYSREAGIVQEKVDALCDVFADDYGNLARAVKQNPAVLMAPATTVQGSWAALLEVFEGDMELTRAVVKQNLVVLTVPVTTVEGSWAALLAVFEGDVELTRAVVKQNPGVLTAPANTVQGSWAALLEVFEDDVELTRAVVKQNPGVLTAPVTTVESSWAALLQVFEGDDALPRSLVKLNPGVLKAPATTVEGSWGALLEVFKGDVEIAQAVVKQCPGVLVARAKTIHASWDALCGLVYEGDEGATKSLLHRYPSLLSSTTIHDSVRLLEQLLGNLSLVQAVAHTHPRVLQSRATTLQSCWEKLVKALGEEQARSVVIKEPTVLCSSSKRFHKLWSDVLEHANFVHQAACRLVVQQPHKWLVQGIARPSQTKPKK